MAKLSVEYDSDGKLETSYEDNSLLDDIKLLQSVLLLAQSVSLEILKKNNTLTEEVDNTIVNICVSFLKTSKIYEANKEVLNSPSPAVHPLLSFAKFRKQ